MNWNELFNTDTIPLIIFFTSAAVVSVIVVISVQWRKVRIAEAEAALKTRMIDKGYSAAEIEKVCQLRTVATARKRFQFSDEDPGQCLY